MAECRHDWKPGAKGIKEYCQVCGAGRVIDPDRCNHDWQLRAGGKKEGCTKCGAARLVLDVHDITNVQDAENPL